MFYVVIRPVVHPGTMEEIESVGSILTEETLHSLYSELGIDEVLASVCYNEEAAKTVSGWVTQ